MRWTPEFWGSFAFVVVSFRFADLYVYTCTPPVPRACKARALALSHTPPAPGTVFSRLGGAWSGGPSLWLTSERRRSRRAGPAFGARRGGRRTANPPPAPHESFSSRRFPPPGPASWRSLSLDSRGPFTSSCQTSPVGPWGWCFRVEGEGRPLEGVLRGPRGEPRVVVAQLGAGRVWDAVAAAAPGRVARAGRWGCGI